MPAFSSTHKVKMGTHAQLVFVFASSWYYLKRKRYLARSVLKFRSLIFLFATSLGCCFFRKWKNGLAFYILWTPWAPEPFPSAGGWSSSCEISASTNIHLLAARRSVPMEKRGCHGKLRSRREKQASWAIRGLVCLYHEGRQQACTPLETRAELGRGAAKLLEGFWTLPPTFAWAGGLRGLSRQACSSTPHFVL